MCQSSGARESSPDGQISPVRTRQDAGKKGKTFRGPEKSICCKGKCPDTVGAETRHRTGKKGQKLLAGDRENGDPVSRAGH